MSEMKNRDNCHELPELLDNLHNRVKVELGRKNEIFYYS